MAKKRVAVDSVGNIFGSYRADIDNILKEFNSSQELFRAEYKVLSPSKDQYNLDRRGIIIEHLGNNLDFNDNFEKYKDNIEILSKKLDKRTSLYEYSFRSEFSDRDKWIDYNHSIVNYNYEL